MVVFFIRHSWQAERGTEIDYYYLLAGVDVVCAIIERKAVNRSINKIIEWRFRQCRGKGKRAIIVRFTGFLGVSLLKCYLKS
jgi:hypothetical protein